MKNNVAVITGAASGIGLALTKICLKNKMHVVMADLSGSLLFEKAKELQTWSQAEVLPIVCDVSKMHEVVQLANHTFDYFKCINLLINNAGISGRLAPIWESDIDDIKKVLDINLYGAIHCIQSFLPLMLKQKINARIVNIASVYGLINGSLVTPYAMSKHAIVALSECLYFDLQRLNKNIDVSVVCPSFVNTDLLKNSKGTLDNKFQEKMINFMQYSNSADDVAKHIFLEIEKGEFYILPDIQVREYCEARVNAIKKNNFPDEHALEKMIKGIYKKSEKTQTV